MGGCLEKPGKPKKSKMEIIRHSKEIIQSDQNSQPSAKNSHQPNRIQKESSFRRKTTNQFLIEFNIEETMQLSSKMEGPKIICNSIDGSSKVLRVCSKSDVELQRLQVFQSICKLQIFVNESQMYLIVDEYCCGPEVTELMKQMVESTDERIHVRMKQEIVNFIGRVHGIIAEFHEKNIWLGNLNISSFRRVSQFKEDVRLVDLNLNGLVSNEEKMGFAHKESKNADWEFFGYLLQFVLLANQCPIFIPHKMIYSQVQCRHQQLIQQLLKGNFLSKAQLDAVQPIHIIHHNQKIRISYLFRRDLNKLIKMRRKRKTLPIAFYGHDCQAAIQGQKVVEDLMYRFETNRIFDRIETYLDEIKGENQQPFLNYGCNPERWSKLKQVFLLRDKEAKMHELREVISTIK